MSLETRNTAFLEFCRQMTKYGFFENAPEVAVAVSGGSDSMGLILLADKWVKPIGGRVIGLSVDHKLRSESASELLQVKEWLSKYEIEHHVLPWGKKKHRCPSMKQESLDINY